jgi:hypothetical protein
LGESFVPGICFDFEGGMYRTCVEEPSFRVAGGVALIADGANTIESTVGGVAAFLVFFGGTYLEYI